ncbi:hypothetical protein H6G41_24095 [Tolypothrix sp. FACHB-123]|uniref:hypothetical protein n=1 Tax=Tolypothrix sp. FACHB-123 TaxID=2692868 RepID=UPI00168A34C6|nr:hypothetical protein [Tolypothrix sp. FACHB-123]MBD2357654.1 hypothetical protein [Tolypothrix sp. FACHB-123]
MKSSQVNWSKQVSSVLARYPQWQHIVIEASNKPLFDVNYCPETIEIFDQFGLLAGRVLNSISYESTRNSLDKSEFIAWLFDGELGAFYVNDEVVINRLQLLTEVGGGYHHD